MITIVLTLPSAPEVGGLDGSGGDTVEVIPMKIRTTCILNLYSYKRIHLSMSMPTDCMHAVVYSYKLHMHHSRFDLPPAASLILTLYGYLPEGREGAGVGVRDSVISTL